jgi:UDPglucose 6-dehydrogenase
VRRGIGSDPRIGHHFLYAGCGYGGSCFPKDVKALLHSAAGVDEPLQVLSAVEQANQRQKEVLDRTRRSALVTTCAAGVFALWGLAFKPDTDDMREAPSRVIIEELIARGARVTAHDPQAIEAARQIFAGQQGLEFVDQPMDATGGRRCADRGHRVEGLSARPISSACVACCASRWSSTAATSTSRR